LTKEEKREGMLDDTLCSSRPYYCCQGQVNTSDSKPKVMNLSSPPVDFFSVQQMEVLGCFWAVAEIVPLSWSVAALCTHSVTHSVPGLTSLSRPSRRVLGSVPSSKTPSSRGCQTIERIDIENSTLLLLLLLLSCAN